MIRTVAGLSSSLDCVTIEPIGDVTRPGQRGAGSLIEAPEKETGGEA